MRLLAVVKNPASIARDLAAAGKLTDVPSRAPGRGPRDLVPPGGFRCVRHRTEERLLPRYRCSGGTRPHTRLSLATPNGTRHEKSKKGRNE